MNDLDNFCIANSLAQDNGWSLGQQWGFASFMNGCDRAAQSRRLKEALERQIEKATAVNISLQEQLRILEEMKEDFDAQNWASEEMETVFDAQCQKVNDLSDALDEETQRLNALNEAVDAYF